MSIELYWDNEEQTVMLCEFGAQWSWDDLFDMLETIKKVTAQRDYEIGAIIDVSNGMSIPGGSIFNFEARNKAKQMLKMSEGGRGPMAIVGANGLIKTVYSAFGTLDKSVQNDVYFARTVNEARAVMVDRLAQKTEVPA